MLPTRLHSSALMSQTFLSRGKMVRNIPQIYWPKKGFPAKKGESFDIFSGVNRKQLILRLCPPGSKSLRPIIKAKTVFLLYLALGEFIYCTSRHYTTLCRLRTQLHFYELKEQHFLIFSLPPFLCGRLEKSFGHISDLV